MTLGGQQNLLDYTEGRGVCEGARIVFFLRKCALAEHGGTQQTFALAHKAAPLALGIDGAISIFKADRAEMAADDVYPFRPTMLCAVSMPDGQPLDRAYLEYVCEKGQRHYDGHPMDVARILFAPNQMRYRPPPAPEDVRPITDGTVLMQREKLTALLRTYKDGPLGGW